MPVARKSAVKVATSKVKADAQARAEVRPRPLHADEVDPAFHRAILKIALELKKPNARSYDEIVHETIRAMRLDPVGFRRYLGAKGARGMSLLLATTRVMGP